MSCVDRVGQWFTEHRKVGRVPIPIKEEHSIWVDVTHPACSLAVPRDKSVALLVGGFVEQVEAGDPSVALVMIGQDLP
jgi:hypothetical protein